MPVRNALATAQLSYAQRGKGAPFHVTIAVWSHSYDHPDAARRNALVTGVYLADLPASGVYNVSNILIRDRYNVDQTGLWTRTSGANLEGFEGYTEFDTHGACGNAWPNVIWSAYSGIYDERCVADATVDAFRLQTYRIAHPQISVYNYMLGPVTFSFEINLPAAPTSVGLRLGLIGGNAGNPAQRTNTVPNEEWVIQFA
ncbi:MAG TPA: hypothetical protein VGH98_19540 [Gemmatimonadaceae bacterium]|jgi:hypothetical protein